MNKDINKDVNNNDYDLITEKINQKPWRKYPKTFKVIRIFLCIALFGVVTGFTFASVQDMIFNKQEKVTVETLSIDRDVMPTDSTVNASGDDRQPVDFNGIVAVLKNNVDSMMSSIVTVDCAKNSVDDFIADSVSPTETAGIIIGDIARKYIILTDLNSIKDQESVVVKLTDACQVDAELIGEDLETGLAVITIKEIDIPPEIRDTLGISELDNSYALSPGEWVVMMGRLHGQSKAVDYTTITSVTKQSITDNITSVFNTGVARSEGDYGFMFNSSGNLVGINTSNVDDTEESTFTAFGVSELKSLVEDLSNSRAVKYLGIRGQRVTSDISVSYSLPVGLFISEIMVDSPAYDAGLQMGDVITELDGNVVQTFSQLNEKLENMRVGQFLSVTVMRTGRDSYNKLTFNVAVGSR